MYLGWCWRRTIFDIWALVLGLSIGWVGVRREILDCNYSSIRTKTEPRRKLKLLFEEPWTTLITYKAPVSDPTENQGNHRTNNLFIEMCLGARFPGRYKVATRIGIIVLIDLAKGHSLLISQTFRNLSGLYFLFSKRRNWVSTPSSVPPNIWSAHCSHACLLPWKTQQHVKTQIQEILWSPQLSRITM